MHRRIEVETINAIKEALNGSLKYKLISNCGFFEVNDIFNSIEEKEENYKFPDFFFKGGIIEHFVVSGYKESKKGSDFMIEKFNNEKHNEKFFEENDKQYLASNYEANTLSSVANEIIYENSSYSCFLSSFKKNFLHHLDSLKNSSYCDDVVVFVIEQLDGRMRVFENNEFNRFYLLSKDKTVLSFLESMFPQVNFLIFKSGDSIEIIDLSKIDDLLPLSSQEKDIRGGSLKEISIKIYLDL